MVRGRKMESEQEDRKVRGAGRVKGGGLRRRVGRLVSLLLDLLSPCRLR